MEFFGNTLKKFYELLQNGDSQSDLIQLFDAHINNMSFEFVIKYYDNPDSSFKGKFDKIVNMGNSWSHYLLSILYEYQKNETEALKELELAAEMNNPIAYRILYEKYDYSVEHLKESAKLGSHRSCYLYAMLQTDPKKKCKWMLRGHLDDYASDYFISTEFRSLVLDLLKENKKLKADLIEAHLRPPGVGGSLYQEGLQSALSNGFQN